MQVEGVASISIEVLEQANVHLANKFRPRTLAIIYLSFALREAPSCVNCVSDLRCVWAVFCDMKC